MFRFKRVKLLKSFVIVFLFLLIINFFYRAPTRVQTINTKDEPFVDKDVDEAIKAKYLLQMDESRINRLFDIIHKKEDLFHPILESLGLLSFKNLISNKDNYLSSNKFKQEADKYLKVEKNQVLVTKSFINYLYNISEQNTFLNPRKNVIKALVKNQIEKPVIITAADSAYYAPLQATVYHVHKYFPDYTLVIYDLGLTANEHEITVKNCKCKVIKFNSKKQYSKVSSHIEDLKTYAWKPILIQETLKEYETVIYIDSSIRFKSNEIEPIVSSLRAVGMLTQFIGLKLNCYTNPKMYTWFGETTQTYENFDTIEANILLFHRTFLTSLIMKAWVTCALDESCIAPVGSSISGCCGCHRFDQDAITVVNSFFYGHPKDSTNFLPPYSFTTQESYFFDIRRYEGKSYFKS